MSPAQAKALALAKRARGAVYAGWNPSSGAYVNAQTIRALERAGYMTVSKTSVGEMVGTLTRAGNEAADRVTSEA